MTRSLCFALSGFPRLWRFVLPCLVLGTAWAVPGDEVSTMDSLWETQAREPVPAGAETRLELRKQWKTFLRKHADAIRNGKRFKAGDPALSPVLTGQSRF